MAQRAYRPRKVRRFDSMKDAIEGCRRLGKKRMRALVGDSVWDIHMGGRVNFVAHCIWTAEAPHGKRD
jgi:hypothetical protein